MKFHEMKKIKTDNIIKDEKYIEIELNGAIDEAYEEIRMETDDSSIIISKVIVSADDFAKAAEVIRSTLGAETEVINADS